MLYFNRFHCCITGMLKPCIMDVKIGAKTYGPDASQEKIQKQQASYAGSATYSISAFALPIHFRFCISAFSLLKLCNLLRFFSSTHTDSISVLSLLRQRHTFHFRFFIYRTCSIQFFHYWSSVIYSVFSLLEQYSIIYSDHYWII